MKMVSLRTARRRVGSSVRRVGAGVLMMGLSLSASAGNDSTAAAAKKAPASGKSVSSAAKPSAKLLARTRSWFQVGVASWYGTQFQGRRTAGGERFDMNTMTCAHPSLPMGTWLRVTNLRNHKTAFVRVNDRGPVVEGRIVDLSYAAAQALGMPGMANVRLEKVAASDPQLTEALMAQVQMPSALDSFSR